MYMVITKLHMMRWFPEGRGFEPQYGRKTGNFCLPGLGLPISFLAGGEICMLKFD
jgi:hypothetical protein